MVLIPAGSCAWRRLGELSTDMFLLGIHRDPEDEVSSELPSCVLETRRRLFAAAYQLDKSMATLLGRPPRISWRHCDCRLPSDISDGDLFAGKHTLEHARNCLDSSGWNTNPVHQRASWIRLRFIISTFREEVLELFLQKPSAHVAESLR